jgi:hypothetical protein
LAFLGDINLSQNSLDFYSLGFDYIRRTTNEKEFYVV